MSGSGFRTRLHPVVLSGAVWFAISVLLGWGSLRELARISRRLLPDEPDRRILGALPDWIAVAACAAAAVAARVNKANNVVRRIRVLL